MATSGDEDRQAMIRAQARLLSPVYQLLADAAMRERARRAGELAGDYKPVMGQRPLPDGERPTG